jgi:hypothetical protein
MASEEGSLAWASVPMTLSRDVTDAVSAAYKGEMRRYAKFVGIAASVIVATVLVAGCANSRSILYSGVSGNASGAKRVVTDAAALHDARAAREQWVAEITRLARADPSQRFANLPARQLRLRLAEAAARYGFTVKKVQFLHPRQLAPLVIIETRRYLTFADAVPAIEDSLDPHRGHSDRAGWAFEGFFLEARDERGVPFVDVFNFMRGSGPGGGQWARSEQLYPFAHG